ncbi:MAG TPA: GNAT family N-acetyltransferase [Thermoanaerobaculia bacterium]
MNNSDIRLRDVHPNDLPVFFEQQLDLDAIRMAAFPARDKDAFAAHWEDVLSDGAVTTKTILFEGRVAGYIVSFERSGRPLVGYWLGKGYWGRGIATRALSQFLDVVAMRPLYAHVARHNVASIRVLEKCGFRDSGEEIGPAASDEVEEIIMVLGAS